MSDKEASQLIDLLITAVERVRQRAAGGVAGPVMPVIEADQFVDQRAAGLQQAQSWHFLFHSTAPSKGQKSSRMKQEFNATYDRNAECEQLLQAGSAQGDVKIGPRGSTRNERVPKRVKSAALTDVLGSFRNRILSQCAETRKESNIDTFSR